MGFFLRKVFIDAGFLVRKTRVWRDCREWKSKELNRQVRSVKSALGIRVWTREQTNILGPCSAVNRRTSWKRKGNWVLNDPGVWKLKQQWVDVWKYVERERALNGGDTLSSRPLIDGSLSTEFLWQSKSHRGAHWRTHRAERQNTRIHEKILEMAAVKTTWVESLGQDSSMCWTHIENFNLCEKFDKNTFWQNLSFYFRPMIIILWQYHPIPFWAWRDFFESWRCQYSKILW